MHVWGITRETHSGYVRGVSFDFFGTDGGYTLGHRGRTELGNRFKCNQKTSQHLIEQVSLFASLRHRNVVCVAACRVKRLSSGQVLIAAGTPFEAFYVVMSGRLAVYTNAKPSGDP